MALAWASNAVAILAFGVGHRATPRALHKSMITVGGSSLLLIYYILVMAQPHVRESALLKLLLFIGWVAMIAGFAYFWIQPVWLNLRYR